MLKSLNIKEPRPIDYKTWATKEGAEFIAMVYAPSLVPLSLFTAYATSKYRIPWRPTHLVAFTTFPCLAWIGSTTYMHLNYPKTKGRQNLTIECAASGLLASVFPLLVAINKGKGPRLLYNMYSSTYIQNRKAILFSLAGSAAIGFLTPPLDGVL